MNKLIASVAIAMAVTCAALRARRRRDRQGSSAARPGACGADDRARRQSLRRRERLMGQLAVRQCADAVAALFGAAGASEAQVSLKPKSR